MLSHSSHNPHSRRRRVNIGLVYALLACSPAGQRGAEQAWA